MTTTSQIESEAALLTKRHLQSDVETLMASRIRNRPVLLHFLG